MVLQRYKVFGIFWVNLHRDFQPVIMNRLLFAIIMCLLWFGAAYASDPLLTASYIVVDKGAMTVTVYDAGYSQMFTTPISCGRGYGDKKREGDNRTPEGFFSISEICNASSWSHDFNDGLGNRKGAYGGWFLRLKTPPHTGIGIHGTHIPQSLGYRDSEGCIRLENSMIELLKTLVEIGTPVVILPSWNDEKVNNRMWPLKAQELIFKPSLIPLPVLSPHGLPLSKGRR